MDKSNLELFKQALSEGVSNRFDKIAAECAEEIVCSDKHKLIMQTIVYGKAAEKRGLSPRVKRIIAILVAAALLFTSCGIIFRNELREIFDKYFVKISYDSEEADLIEDVYELGYLPEGYSLKDEKIRPVRVSYEFENEAGDYIWFEQKLLDGTDFYIDSESGYRRIDDINNHKVYYRHTDGRHVYVWNDGKYSMFIRSNLEIPVSEIVLILEGLVSK